MYWVLLRIPFSCQLNLCCVFNHLWAKQLYYICFLLVVLWLYVSTIILYVFCRMCCEQFKPYLIKIWNTRLVQWRRIGIYMAVLRRDLLSERYRYRHHNIYKCRHTVAMRRQGIYQYSCPRWIFTGFFFLAYFENGKFWSAEFTGKHLICSYMYKMS